MAKSNALALRLRAAVFVLAILLCLGWTLWPMALTLVPNDTANHVLGTSDLDGGTFWFFPEMPLVIGSLGIAGLAIATLGSHGASSRFFAATSPGVWAKAQSFQSPLPSAPSGPGLARLRLLVPRYIP